MLISPQNLAENLRSVRASIASAAQSAGRPSDCVTLVAVSKGQEAAAVRAALALGQRDFGESYPQEGVAKIEALDAPQATWHFIGQLQSNKTRRVAERFQWVHGVDRAQIAARLSAQRPHYAPPLNVCLQVMLAPELGKAGVDPEHVAALANEVAGMARLKLRGLMCMPPAESDFERQRAWFRETRQVFDYLNERGFGLDTLSMGTSSDFEAAIAEGATIVRIGTAIFGARN